MQNSTSLKQSKRVQAPFSLLTDLDGQTLPAGSETSVVVAYVPVQDIGDQGDFVIYSDDLMNQKCRFLVGNGGGESTYPVASLLLVHPVR